MYKIGRIVYCNGTNLKVLPVVEEEFNDYDLAVKKAYELKEDRISAVHEWRSNMRRAEQKRLFHYLDYVIYHTVDIANNPHPWFDYDDVNENYLIKGGKV